MILPCSAQICKTIRQLKRMLWTDDISRDLSLRWVSGGYLLWHSRQIIQYVQSSHFLRMWQVSYWYISSYVVGHFKWRHRIHNYTRSSIAKEKLTNICLILLHCGWGWLITVRCKPFADGVITIFVYRTYSYTYIYICMPVWDHIYL